MAVVGFGRASQSIVRYLHESGIRVLVSDIRNYSELSPKEQELLDKCAAEFEGGGHSTGFLSRADIVVASPGVDHRHSVLEKVRQSGATVLGELALAADKFTAPVIGVTGTNGKTTVTELIGSMFRAAGKKVFVGGNIGTPLGDLLISDEKFEAIVLELSSFQLELIATSPPVGAILNVTPNHLDRHKTMDAYRKAKSNILRYQDVQDVAVAVPLLRNVVGVLDESAEWHLGVGDVEPVIRCQRVTHFEHRADRRSGGEAFEPGSLRLLEEVTGDFHIIRRRQRRNHAPCPCRARR